jgi:hypothetical protein
MDDCVPNVRNWALFLHEEDDIDCIPNESQYGLKPVTLATLSGSRMDSVGKEFTDNWDIVQDSV